MDQSPSQIDEHRGPLRSAIAPELAAAGHGDENASARRLAHGLSLSDIAHALELHASGSLDDAPAAELMRGLLELHEIPGDVFPWDATIGDPFNCREHELGKRIGKQAAGWLSAGRPRREAMRVALRLTSRAGALEIQAQLVRCAASLQEQAERYSTDLAADYTYLQPAQPSTIGHLLLTYQQPLLRDVARLQRLHSWLDASIAGVGGTAGSRWPLDRHRLAQMLGCGSVMSHTKDAMWQYDGYVELLSLIASSMAGLSQLAQDLEIYSSGEFGFVEFDDAHARESALMPQKKNPYAMVVVRTHAAKTVGYLTSALTALHTGSARTDHFQLLNSVVPQAIEETVQVLALMAEALRGLQIDADRWGRAAQEGMVVAADVADELSRTTDLDYRTAHTIVGQALRTITDQERAASTLTVADLQASANAVTGHDLQLDEAAISAALDPSLCVGQRPQEGSCSEPQMQGQLGRSQELIASATGWLAEQRQHLEQAEHQLLEAARAQLQA